MGIDYECVFVFGVAFTFDDLKPFLQHPETQQLIDDMGEDCLMNLWKECGYAHASPHYASDDDECEYFLGYVILDTQITPEEMSQIISKKEDVKSQILAFCQKYNVRIPNDCEPKFFIKRHIY